MKAELKEEVEGFKPIQILVTIESEDELKNLHYRLQTSSVTTPRSVAKTLDDPKFKFNELETEFDNVIDSAYANLPE